MRSRKQRQINDLIQFFAYAVKRVQVCHYLVGRYPFCALPLQAISPKTGRYVCSPLGLKQSGAELTRYQLGIGITTNPLTAKYRGLGSLILPVDELMPIR